MSTEGKAGPVKDVGGDSEKDAKVQELVTNFIENSDDVTTQSQSSYRTTSVSESDNENEEDEDDEDDIESGNNKSEFSNEKTSTLYIRHV